MLVADVDRRRRPRLASKSRALRLEVALHRAVEVEVVLRQVREDERREADAVEPAQLEPCEVASIAQVRSPGVEHLPEAPLQVDRLGRRSSRRPALAADAALDRAEQPGRRPAAARIA